MSIERLVSLVVDESKWLAASLACAGAAVAALVRRSRGPDAVGRRRVLAAMNLGFGVTIGTMALGHLLAVSTKLVQGTLEGSPPYFYAIGLALAVPAAWVVAHTRRILAPGDAHGPTTSRLNAWLAATLLALGLHNLPLAAPGILNLLYPLHSRRATGWAIVALTALVYAGLAVGSLVFLASGQSFEQFAAGG